VVKHLPSKHKALSSNPIPPKQKTNGTAKHWTELNYSNFFNLNTSQDSTCPFTVLPLSSPVHMHLSNTFCCPLLTDLKQCPMEGLREREFKCSHGPFQSFGHPNPIPFSFVNIILTRPCVVYFFKQADC
jgi:hypothetical protein